MVKVKKTKMLKLETTDEWGLVEDDWLYTKRKSVFKDRIRRRKKRTWLITLSLRELESNFFVRQLTAWINLAK